MNLRTVITGTNYRGREAINAVLGLRRGDQIVLKREPNNDKDLNAIECWFGGRKIGYVPKRHNYGLAMAMDAGAEPRAVIANRANLKGAKIGQEPELTIEWDEKPKTNCPDCGAFGDSIFDHVDGCPGEVLGGVPEGGGSI